MIKPNRKPDDILGDNYEIIKEILRNFAKSRAEWDDYARKIDPQVRATMSRCFAECRENGFYGPHVGSDGEIHFGQMVEMSEPINEVYRVEVEGHDGKGATKEIKVVAKQFITPSMKIIERVK